MLELEMPYLNVVYALFCGYVEKRAWVSSTYVLLVVHSR